MKKMATFVVVMLLVSCLLPSAGVGTIIALQPPPPPDLPFDFPMGLPAWQTSTTPEPPTPSFSTTENMITALKSRDVSRLMPDLQDISTEQEIAYMHMVYTLFAVGGIPVLENSVYSPTLYTQSWHQSVAVEYGLGRRYQNRKVCFVAKDITNVKEYYDDAERQSIYTVTVDGKEYGGLYLGERRQNEKHFIVDYSNSYFLLLKVITEETVTAEDMIDIIDDLRISFVDLYAK